MQLLMVASPVQAHQNHRYHSYLLRREYWQVTHFSLCLYLRFWFMSGGFVPSKCAPNINNSFSFSYFLAHTFSHQKKSSFFWAIELAEEVEEWLQNKREGRNFSRKGYSHNMECLFCPKSEILRPITVGSVTLVTSCPHLSYTAGSVLWNSKHISKLGALSSELSCGGVRFQIAKSKFLTARLENASKLIILVNSNSRNLWAAWMWWSRIKAKNCARSLTHDVLQTTLREICLVFNRGATTHVQEKMNRCYSTNLDRFPVY
jgi:hypothetical protein